MSVALSRVGVAGMATVAYVRLFFGVDFTDEAFYSAIPWSLAHGGQPYRDELSLAQNTGVLLEPVYWLFARLTGDATGLILLNRHLYFLVLAGCAWLAWRVGRAHAGATTGRWLAAIVFGFSYYNIPALSYNTLGSFALFGGVWLLLWHAGTPRGAASGRLIAGANLCWILATFAYPSFLGASLAGLGVSAWSVRAARGDRSWWAAGGGAWVASVAVGAIAAAAFVAWVGVDGVQRGLEYTRGNGYDYRTGFERAVRLLPYWARRLGQPLGMTLATGTLVVLAVRGRRHAAILGGAALVAAAFSLHALGQPGVTHFFSTASTPVVLSLGVVFPLAAWRSGVDAAQFNRIVLPACLLGAGACTLSSTNSLWAATLALFPAAVATWLTIGCRSESPSAVAPVEERPRLIFGGLSALLCLFLAGSLLGQSYRDLVFLDDTGATWGSGPYAGIATTPRRAALVRALQEDLAAQSHPGKTLFVHGDLPAGYLFSALSPRTFSAWVFWPPDKEAARRRWTTLFEPPARRPDVVLKTDSAEPWVTDALVAAGYAPVVSRPEFGYEILTRESPPRAPKVASDGMDDDKSSALPRHP